MHQNAAGRTVPPASQALQPLPVLSMDGFVSITLKSLPSSPSQQLPFRCFSQPLLSPVTPCTSIPCHELPPTATSCRCGALLSLPSACPATRLSLCPRALPASAGLCVLGPATGSLSLLFGFHYLLPSEPPPTRANTPPAAGGAAAWCRPLVQAADPAGSPVSKQPLIFRSAINAVRQPGLQLRVTPRQVPVLLPTIFRPLREVLFTGQQTPQCGDAGCQPAGLQGD